MARSTLTVELTEDEKHELQRRVRATTISRRDLLRAEIILFRAEGLSQADCASQLNIPIKTVNKWSQRWDLLGLVGLRHKPRPGRVNGVPPEKCKEVIERAVKDPPPGCKRWSVRKMAKATGVSPSSVNRIWKNNDIKPHLVRTFKVSNDPKFKEKFWDVIGLYLNPPERSLILCCDEKSQCQALERTQPGLPLGVGEIRTKTHDYKRHGTITLFAALNYLDGKLLTRTEVKHTHVEWLRFLKQIDRETPKELDIHLIIDNYCTHKEASVKEWLSKHPRFHIHFTPTSSSWLN